MSNETPHNSCLDIALPGYTLSEQLGAGGYGEVWRATAPGGLTKAVKFVFGHYSDKRAAHELKALEKIKEVRHPFLLSLERIEVLEDRLVIITELADASLKDRFDECVGQGLPGVPRDELLNYLRDTADALDFLSTKHSLQHLDVKPENLLLLAGHIKVADFGLVKEVHNSQASLVGGLTPLYASPEVFQGRPTAFSDQYSLAVVYQEMLTGVLPFVGASAAELTMHHLNDEPDLAALPAADRFTVARALAKNGDQRFGSCKEFVNALMQGGSQWHQEESDRTADTEIPIEAAAKARAEQTPRRGPVTEVFDEVLGGGGKPATPSVLLDVPERKRRAATELPAIDVPVEQFAATPTLVIGVGGVGGEILCQVRRQLDKRFGDSRDVPAVQLLLMDSDQKAIMAATNTNRQGALRSDETLSLGLRRPQDYRDRSDRLQQWLSRRWLYNIPKSLNTEGLRPLGRLALVDHAKRTLQRIRMSAAAALETEAVDASSSATGVPFERGALRVYVVASISGGTGGGSSLDLGYAIRSVLEKLGVEQAATIGLFTHSTGMDQRSCELARVNAYSWLTEFRHALQPNFAYPGDAGAGLPSFPAGVLPFDHSYLVRLQDALDEGEMEQAVERVAEYLVLDALTPAQEFFDACRNEEAADADAVGEASSRGLRSFGVQRVVAASAQEVARASSRVAQHIIQGWSGKTHAPAPSGPSRPQSRVLAGSIAESTAEEERPSERDTNHLVHGATQLVAKLQLNLDGVASTMREVMEARFDGNLERFYLRTLAQLRETGKEVDYRLATEVANDFFIANNQAPLHHATHLLGHPLARLVGPLGLKLAGDLRRWLMEKLDDPQERLAGAKLGVDWLVDHFKAVETDAARLAATLGRQVLETSGGLQKSAKAHIRSAAADDAQADPLLKYLRLRFDHCAVKAAEILAGVLLAELKTTCETLIEFGRHLSHVAGACLDSDDDAASHHRQLGGESAAMAGCTETIVTACLTDLAKEVDLQTQENYIAPNGGLFETVMSNSRVRSGLLETMQREAAAAVRRKLGQMDLIENLLTDGEAGRSLLGGLAKAAEPQLLSYGGAVRRLAITPHAELTDEQKAQLREKMGEAALIADPRADFTFCCEAERIPIPDLALDIIEARRDYAEFAARVHTRKDIRWIELAQTPGVATRSTSIPEVDMRQSTPTATQMV